MESKMDYVYRILAHADKSEEEYEEAIADVLVELAREGVVEAKKLGLSAYEVLEIQETKWIEVCEFIEEDELKGAFEVYLGMQYPQFVR